MGANDDDLEPDGFQDGGGMSEADVFKNILGDTGENDTFLQKVKRHMTKGNVANGISFVIMVIGLVLVAVFPKFLPVQFILAFGLFAFAGGITNWVAIKMLFDKIPGLYGSGIIEDRFVEIRETIKGVIMRTFFDAEYLERYLAQKAGQLAGSFDVEGQLKKLLESDVVDEIIDEKLAELRERPEGMWLSMMGVDNSQLKPMIKPFILGMGSDVAPMILKNFDPTTLLNIDKIRTEVDTLLSTKLEALTAKHVKTLLETVMRKHLGWLVVWGNIFGGTIGLVTKAIEVE
eukprot:CAMPEP_0114626136 /NCGR_PEP_ID=MMETSP0168-20121206/11624_1 /TAXON_ID=95228 ORGANISM="Vannella sp., Strain DIVA3 517/6/12" /NCGR_SAMPLE_ID=MMETSP0168 /ASSEMBLY_ACC=CAM_ASM_000044 /LENGTH=288 /DNA_ID=CAMNT_0001837427 /DNA_START=69 /DNA_END=932 /DNA_ORIENTATION=+